MSNEEPHEYTHDEIREKLFRHVHSIVKYWESESRAPDIHSKLEGVAFSILSMIDGGSGDICGFKLIPSTHKDDKAYHKSEGENWFPYVKDHKHDICDGELHSQFLNFNKEKV